MLVVITRFEKGVFANLYQSWCFVFCRIHVVFPGVCSFLESLWSMLAVVSRNLQKVKLHRVPQEKAWENVFMLVCCFSAPRDTLAVQSVPFSLVSSSCIFSTRIWRRDFSLQYRKSLVPLYEVEDWLEAGGIDPQTWADQHTWEEQRFPSETKATAWDFFWRWKKKQHYTPPASPTFSPTASLDQPLWPGCLAYMPLSDRSQ